MEENLLLLLNIPKTMNIKSWKNQQFYITTSHFPFWLRKRETKINHHSPASDYFKFQEFLKDVIIYIDAFDFTPGS